MSRYHFTICSKNHDISIKNSTGINKWSAMFIIRIILYKTMNYHDEFNGVSSMPVLSSAVKFQTVLLQAPHYDDVDPIGQKTQTCTRQIWLKMIAIVV